MDSSRSVLQNLKVLLLLLPTLTSWYLRLLWPVTTRITVLRSLLLKRSGPWPRHPWIGNQNLVWRQDDDFCHLFFHIVWKILSTAFCQALSETGNLRPLFLAFGTVGGGSPWGFF